MTLSLESINNCIMSVVPMIGFFRHFARCIKEVMRMGKQFRKAAANDCRLNNARQLCVHVLMRNSFAKSCTSSKSLAATVEAL